ncbi:hypothetical protein [Mannheimia massilioguelmaensis]|uniref:hypothetical protein n=1 Tax=Mannheimia massilioguelmaensis TaxID=1604354 RepID=UPI0005C91528|nr:hypothetical protein [Mannheimia massilioguelmaensis]
MEIKSFSFVKLVVDSLVITGFIIAALNHNEPILNVFIWVFWTFSTLSFLSAFAIKNKDWSRARANQSIYSELAISLALVYFGYPVLATFSLVAALLLSGAKAVDEY